MTKLSDAQVLAAAAQDRLVYVEAVPGSGKTSIAAERYGYLRYHSGDLRGVLGLTFNRAASIELRQRIELRWGVCAVTWPHRVVTFDQLHVDALTHLLRERKVMWLENDILPLDVRDDYVNMQGFRAFFCEGEYGRVADLDDKCVVVSRSRKMRVSSSGFSKKECHERALKEGVVSHDDVRSILLSAVKRDDLRQAVTEWLVCNYRALIVDEVYDADSLDLAFVSLAAEAGLSVTIVGDPWQTLYAWRGAKPELVSAVLNGSHDMAITDGCYDGFVKYEQVSSFRFQGPQVSLTADLRAGVGVTLPVVESTEVDVALARCWADLWCVGSNVLPLSFGTVYNKVDAVMNLLLDVVTRSRFGQGSFGYDGAVTKLGLSIDNFRERRDGLFVPMLESLSRDCSEMSCASVLTELCLAVKSLGVSKPPVTGQIKQTAVRRLGALGVRLLQENLIPGLTVFQAKGREWDRVGVVLSNEQNRMLKSGLQPFKDGWFNEEQCIIYVALTRARLCCGKLENCNSESVTESKKA